MPVKKKVAKKTAAKKQVAKKTVVKAAKPTPVDRPAHPSAITVSVPQPDFANNPALRGAGGALAQATLMKVDSQESSIEAGRALVQLKGLKDSIEAQRMSLTRPLKDTAKRIEAMYKPTLEKLAQADQLIRSKVLKFRADSEAANAAKTAELMEKATEAQDAGDNDTALALATEATEQSSMAKTTLLEQGSMQMKKVWDFEVTDLGSVPHEYCTLDATKVRAAIRAGVRELPGLRIFQKDSMAISAGGAMPYVEPMSEGGVH